MAVKRCFKVKDELMDCSYVLCGQSGFLYDDNKFIILLDTIGMGEYLAECCYDGLEEPFEEACVCSKTVIRREAEKWGEYIKNMIVERVVEEAEDRVINDEFGFLIE